MKLSVTEVATKLGVSETSIRRHMENKDIKKLLIVERVGKKQYTYINEVALGMLSERVEQIKEKFSNLNGASVNSDTTKIVAETDSDIKNRLEKLLQEKEHQFELLKMELENFKNMIKLLESTNLDFKTQIASANIEKQLILNRFSIEDKTKERKWWGIWQK